MVIMQVCVILCSGCSATCGNWTCRCWVSLRWSWPTRRGTSTWSFHTVQCPTTRWDGSTFPYCRTMDTSFSGSLAGEWDGYVLSINYCTMRVVLSSVLPSVHSSVCNIDVLWPYRLDCLESRRFDSRLFHCQVTTLGNSSNNNNNNTGFV